MLLPGIVTSEHWEWYLGPKQIREHFLVLSSIHKFAASSTQISVMRCNSPRLDATYACQLLIFKIILVDGSFIICYLYFTLSYVCYIMCIAVEQQQVKMMGHTLWGNIVFFYHHLKNVLCRL